MGQVEKDIFKDRLNGGILIDLGFGKVPLMKALATRYKSKTYIGVDRYSIGKEDESSDPHKVMDDLSKNDIQTLIHYPIPPHKQEAYKEFNHLKFKEFFGLGQIVSVGIGFPF